MPRGVLSGWRFLERGIMQYGGIERSFSFPALLLYDVTNRKQILDKKEESGVALQSDWSFFVGSQLLLMHGGFIAVLGFPRAGTRLRDSLLCI